MFCAFMKHSPKNSGASNKTQKGVKRSDTISAQNMRGLFQTNQTARSETVRFLPRKNPPVVVLQTPLVSDNHKDNQLWFNKKIPNNHSGAVKTTRMPTTN